MFLRKNELETLKTTYTSDRAELIIIYGRRRLGKTTLVLESIKEIQGLYFYTLNSDIESIVEYYIESLRQQTDIRIFGEIRDFKDFLEILHHHYKDKKVVIIIDEFQRLHNADPKSVSYLQDFWDRQFKKTKIKLVLVGSIIGLIEKIALRGDAPLFGRRTLEMRLEPLPYSVTRKFWLRLKPEERILAYGVFGGTPAYIDSYDFGKTIWSNIEDLIINKNGRLNREPEELLSEELRNITVYTSILRRIAEGRRGLPLSKIKHGNINVIPYIRTLEKMSIIERVHPIGERKRSTLYVFKDEFFRFWYRFIPADFWLIEMERYDIVIEKIKENINDYLSYTVEKILRELIALYSGRKLKHIDIPKLEKLGSYWDNEIEIDVLGVGRDTVVIGEAKWRDRPTTIKDIGKAINKAEYITQKLKKKKYVLVYLSKKGYKRDYQEESIITLTPDDLETALNHIK